MGENTIDAHEWFAIHQSSVNVKRFLLGAQAMLIASAVGLVGVSGCATYAPAAADRTFSASAAPATGDRSLWPARVMDKLREIIEIAPDVLSVRVRYDTVDGGRLVKSPRRLPSKETQHSLLCGRGIIRTYNATPEPGHASDRVASIGMCFFTGVEGKLAADAKAPGKSAPKKRNTTVKGEEDNGNPWVVNLRGTWMRLDYPTSGESPRGLILHLTSFGGYEYEKPVLEELRSRGWAVLWVDSSTVKPETTKVEVNADDPREAAKRIAGNIDERVSEIAYAAEAGLDYIHKYRPEIPTTPLVVTGYSAGSLATPTTVALLGDQVDAAVLVGSGCNLLEISQRSALTDGGLKLVWNHTPTPEQRQRLNDEYLIASHLDPYWTAAALTRKPVLMLHATLDKIVPADCGELLYQRLNRPERVNFFLGHELLFLRLPAHADLIANWIDDTMAMQNRERTQYANK
jgi:dienelactone hydrolase